ncbi:MAG: cytochrome c oxidase subunit II [Candidatus Zixiibacteriota bacterium]
MDTTRTLFLPPGGSTVAPEVDALFNFLVYVAIAFFVLIMTMVIVFAVRYRRRGPQVLTPGISHNTALEMTWITIPLILVGIVFVWGFRGYLKQSVVPKDALEVRVTGQKWFWSFAYPEGATSINELVVPAGKPIKLLLSSQDVIHSFYVPDFRIKRDALPNRYTITWFEAPRPGNHHLFCAEYCGTKHSAMIGTVRVVSDREYQQWLESTSASGTGMSAVDFGAKLYVSKTCNSCHSNDGRAMNGPTFRNLYGHDVEMTGGGRVIVDENYLRESILDPRAKVVAGYQPIMPTFQGLIKTHEMDALIAYIKSLSPTKEDDGQPAPRP